MAFFEKREVVFHRRDKEDWEKAKAILKQAGVEGIRCRAYDVEAGACGCGSHLDPRDFGPKGKVDRRMFEIRVPQAQAAQCREALGDLAWMGEKGEG